MDKPALNDQYIVVKNREGRPDRACGCRKSA